MTICSEGDIITPEYAYVDILNTAVIGLTTRVVPGLVVSRSANEHVVHVASLLRNGSPTAHNGSYGSPNVTYGDYGQPLTKSVVVSFESSKWTKVVFRCKKGCYMPIVALQRCVSF